MTKKFCIPLCMMLGLVHAASAQQDEASCSRLMNLALVKARIISATLVSAAALPAAAEQKPPESVEVAAHCEVKAVATPSSDSEINLEVWLPLPSAWNGKYMQLGSGGWGGSTSIRGMVTPLNRGYAVASTAAT